MWYSDWYRVWRGLGQQDRKKEKEREREREKKKEEIGRNTQERYNKEKMCSYEQVGAGNL